MAREYGKEVKKGTVAGLAGPSRTADSQRPVWDGTLQGRDHRTIPDQLRWPTFQGFALQVSKM